MATSISPNPEEVPFNPWARSVSTLSDFLYYCCPECDMKEKDMDNFIKHALLNHESAGLLKVFYPDVMHEEIKLPKTKDATISGQSETVKSHEPSEVMRGKSEPEEEALGAPFQESVSIKRELDLECGIRESVAVPESIAFMEEVNDDICEPEAKLQKMCFQANGDMKDSLSKPPEKELHTTKDTTHIEQRGKFYVVKTSKNVKDDRCLSPLFDVIASISHNKVKATGEEV